MTDFLKLEIHIESPNKKKITLPFCCPEQDADKKRWVNYLLITVCGRKTVARSEQRFIGLKG